MSKSFFCVLNFFPENYPLFKKLLFLQAKSISQQRVPILKKLSLKISYKIFLIVGIHCRSIVFLFMKSKCANFACELLYLLFSSLNSNVLVC